MVYYHLTMKSLIKKLLRESLIQGGDIPNRNKLISLGTNSSFESKDLASKHLDRLISKIDSLPQSVRLYRVIFVDDPSQIDRTNIGNHYVLKMRDLEQSHQQISHVGGGEPYVLTVKADKSLIDVPNTLINNMKYPHENEITLKDKGKGAKIIKVEPFKESGEDDFLNMPPMDDFNFDY